MSSFETNPNESNTQTELNPLLAVYIGQILESYKTYNEVGCELLELSNDMREALEQDTGEDTGEGSDISMSRDVRQELARQTTYLGRRILDNKSIKNGVDQFIDELLRTDLHSEPPAIPDDEMVGVFTPVDSLIDQPESKIKDVARIYDGIGRKHAPLPLFSGARTNRAVRAARQLGLTPTQFLEQTGEGIYTEPDIIEVARTIRRSKRVTGVLAGALTLSLAVGLGAISGSDRSEAVSSTKSGLIDATEQTMTTNNVVAPDTTSLPTVPETTLAVLPPADTVPVETTIPPIQYSEYQLRLGKALNIDINGETLTALKDRLIGLTGEAWNEDTIVTYLGISDGYVGSRRVKDCPEGAVLIRKGEYRSAVLANYQLTTEQLEAYNRGIPKFNAGYCLAVTEMQN